MNIAGGENNSLLAAIELIEEAVGRQALLSFEPARAGDQLHTGGDTTRARELLRYAPAVDLRTGIASQVEWQRNAL